MKEKTQKIGMFVGAIILLGLLILFLTYRSTSITVDAAEVEENTLTYNLNSNDVQTENYIDANGEKGTMTIMPDLEDGISLRSIKASGKNTYTVSYKDSVTNTSFKVKATASKNKAKITKAYGLKYKVIINRVDSASLKKYSAKKAQVNFKFSNVFMSWTGYYGVKVSGQYLKMYHD